MLDVQVIIDNIRSILVSAGPTSASSIAPIAANYTEACTGVNERLRKCGQLLRDGLRSEAIQQCEAEPNLLNLVSTLDLPEIEEWNSLLQSYGMSPAIPLLMDVAGDLNEAYSQEQPMAALLRRHRLQALGRSPLRDRINTLRRLAELDVNNQVWQDDLRTYEQARQQEIRRAVDQGVKQGSLGILEACAADVQSDEWLAPPPPALVQQVVDAHNRLMRQHARKELERLEPQLNDAFSQFDEPTARALRDQWNVHFETVELAADDPLYERAAPALEWLDRQDQDADSESRYQAAVADLERALEDEENLSTLERRAHAVLRCERPIPPLLEKRLRSQIGDRHLTRSRRMRLIIAAAVLLFLATASVVAYAIYSNRQAQQIASHAGTLQAFLDRNQLDEAQQHLEKLMSSVPVVASHADIQKLGVELAARRRDETERSSRFAAAIEAAEKAGDEQPDRDALVAAAELARIDSEKARVLKLQTAIAAVDRRRQAERDDAFIGRLKELQARVDNLDRNEPDVEELRNLRTALSELVTQSATVSPAVLSQANIPQQRVAALSEVLARRGMAQEAFKDLDLQIGNPATYQRALLEFVGKLPEAGQSVDFKRVAEELPVWEEVSVWNEFIAKWNEQDASRLDSRQAEELLAACQALINEHAGLPGKPEVERCVAHLEAIVRRGGADGAKLYAPLNELFTDPMIATLWMVETKDEKGTVARYYLVTPPPEIGGNQASVQISFIDDFARVANKQERVRVSEIQFSGQAPQSAIARQAMDALARINSDLWESVFAKILLSIATDKQLDPILKVTLLQRVLEVACDGSESMRKAFAQYREVLNSVPIDPSVPWMDLKNEDTRRTRELANELLGRLPSIQEVLKSAASNLAAFKTGPGSECAWIGWLDRDATGKWICHLPRGDQQDCQMLVPVPTDGKAFRWASVGSIKGGQVELGRENPQVFVQGRPVFTESNGLSK